VSDNRQHTFSISTLAVRSRRGSLSFLRLSLTEILMVISVSGVIALLVWWLGAAIVCVCGDGCDGEVDG
jgi:hypothetical protein